MTSKRTAENDNGPVEWDVGFDQFPTIKLSNDYQHVEICNVRNFRYECDGSHTVCWETRSYRTDTVCSLDFIVVPFSKQPNLAHTMVSFGFSDGRFLSISVEARRRRHQPYSIVKGMLGAYPLMYVIADERDAIGHRTEYRGDVVHLYTSSASPEDAARFFVSMLCRAQQLSEQSETYHTVFNNCLTNLRDHANEIWPRLVRWSWEVLFTGHADNLAYRLGLLQEHESFNSLHEKANITDLAQGNWHRADFSKLIRSRWEAARQVAITRGE